MVLAKHPVFHSVAGVDERSRVPGCVSKHTRKEPASMLTQRRHSQTHGLRIARLPDASRPALRPLEARDWHARDARGIPDGSLDLAESIPDGLVALFSRLLLEQLQIVTD